MLINYTHVLNEEFPIQVPEWSEAMRGVTWEPDRRQGVEVVVLNGQNENGHITALFQVEWHGLYTYYRNLCGNAPDFDTQDQVVDLLRSKLSTNHRILVDVTPRPQYSYRGLDNMLCVLVDLKKFTGVKRNSWDAIVEVHYAIDDQDGNAGSVTLRRRIAIVDLRLRNVIPKPQPEPVTGS